MSMPAQKPDSVASRDYGKTTVSDVEARTRGEAEKFLQRDAVTSWSPDVWIVQQNIERLKRWVAIEYDDARKERLTRLLEYQKQRLIELGSDPA